MVSSDEESDDLLLLRRRQANNSLFKQNGIASHADKNGIDGIRRIKVPNLTDLSLKAFLKDTHITHFEILVVQFCPRTLYPRLLAAALLEPKPRYFLIRVILRHWPIQTLNLDDLKTCFPPFASLFSQTGPNAASTGGKMSARDDSQDVANAVLLNRSLVIILESFAASLGYANHRMRLKCLDLRALPWSLEQHDILLQFLRKHEDLIADWASMEYKSNIRVSIDLRSEDNSVVAFYTTFLKRCPSFVRTQSLVVTSPLVTGESNTMKTVIKHIDKTSLGSLTITGELLFNNGGGYETDVDHLKDIFNGLYKQELPQWIPKLKLFTHLVELSLPIDVPIPKCELEGLGIQPQAKELKRPSPCAIGNWAHVLPLLSPNLRHLSLRGQLIQGHLENLLGRTPFCLASLDLEDCGLIGADLAFLGRSRHRGSLKALKVGDLDMGKKFTGVVQMIKGIKQLETLDLCLDGYDRYTNNVTFDDSQAMELIHLIRQQYTSTLKYLNLGGGHAWSKAVLMKAIKHLVPLPNLQGLNLPVDGLGKDSLETYQKFKTTDAGFKYKLEKCGPEFKELHKAIQHYLRKGCHVTVSLSREGMVMQFHTMSGANDKQLQMRQKAEMKRLEANMTMEFQRREKEQSLKEAQMKEESVKEMNKRKDRMHSSLERRAMRKSAEDRKRDRASLDGKSGAGTKKILDEKPFSLLDSDLLKKAEMSSLYDLKFAPDSKDSVSLLDRTSLLYPLSTAAATSLSDLSATRMSIYDPSDITGKSNLGLSSDLRLTATEPSLSSYDQLAARIYKRPEDQQHSSLYNKPTEQQRLYLQNPTILNGSTETQNARLYQQLDTKPIATSMTRPEAQQSLRMNIRQETHNARLYMRPDGQQTTRNYIRPDSQQSARMYIRPDTQQGAKYQPERSAQHPNVMQRVAQFNQQEMRRGDNGHPYENALINATFNK